MVCFEDEREKEVVELLIQNITLLKDNLRGDLSFTERVAQQISNRNKFVTDNRQIPIGSQSFLVILKRWNSYTPSLPTAGNGITATDHISIGGGYFLYFGNDDSTSVKPGYGLVIDPGFNFIYNFGTAGFSLDDIDGILITHAHNDHTNDLESILSLCHERNDDLKESKKQKKIDLFFNVGSFKKYSNYLDLANVDDKSYIGKVIVMSPGQTYKIPDMNWPDCAIYTLVTKHHEIITKEYALGIYFKVFGRKIVLTSDTGWSYEDSMKNTKYIKDNDPDFDVDNKCDLLISHLGSIKKEEFDITLSNYSECYYKNHLGYHGTIRMLDIWNPKFCIISEFGEELASLRKAIINSIEKAALELKVEVKCTPGDVGLFILLDEQTAFCYKTNQFINVNHLSYNDDEIMPTEGFKYFDVAYNGTLSKEELSNMQYNGIIQKYKSIQFNKLCHDIEIAPEDELSIIDKILAIPDDYSTEKIDTENRGKIIGLLKTLSCVIDEQRSFTKLRESTVHNELISIFLKFYYRN
jgi:hypothetical protein